MAGSKEKPVPKRRPYQPLTFVFGAAVLGILFDRLFDFPFLFWSSGAALSLFATWRTHIAGRPVLSTFFLLSACGLTFGLWHQERWNHFSANDLGRLARDTESPIALDAVVREMPRVYPESDHDPGRVFDSTERTLMTVRAVAVRDGKDWRPASGLVSLTITGNRGDLRWGDSIRIYGALAKPRSPRNPGDYDYAGMLRSKRILCIVRASSPRAVVRTAEGAPGPARLIEGMRRSALARLERTLDEKTAPLAAAMLLGIREGVDEETTQMLFRTGTLHILAISGLHIGLLAATLAFFMERAGVPRRTIALLLVPTVLFYLLLTDVRPPAMRATALVLVASVGMFSYRRTYAANTLCATALVVLAVNPTELFQFGAQLSFLATGAFLWIPSARSLKRFFFSTDPKRDESEPTDLEKLEVSYWRSVLWIKAFFKTGFELFVVGTTIWIVTLPLILERFHLFAPIALVVNPLLWIPLSAALIGGFATMLLGSVPLLGTVVGHLTGELFQALFSMIAFFQSWGGHAWIPGPPSWWNLVFYSVFTAFTFLALPRPPVRLVTCFLFLWIGIGLAAGWVRDMDRRINDLLTIDVFSVGHGSCVLIVTPEKKTVVYDAGCISSPRIGAEILSRGLWRYGKRRIDLLVISHPDSDHYNAAPHLLDRFTVGTVLVSPYMSLKEEEPGLRYLYKKLGEKKVPIVQVGDGDDLARFGFPNAQLFHPPKSGFTEAGNSNASSLVLRLEHHGVGILFPGDLDGRATPPFLLRKPVTTKIVMLPHHGGHSGQTETLLRWARPECLLVSAGRFTYDKKTMDAYRRRGFEVRNTYEEGLIEINLDRHPRRVINRNRDVSTFPDQVK